MSAPRRLKLNNDLRRRRCNPCTPCSVSGHVTLCSSLVGTSSYLSRAAREQPRTYQQTPHIYEQKRARSDGNIFQAISAPNDGIAYHPSLAAGAEDAQGAPRRSQQVVAPPSPPSFPAHGHVIRLQLSSPLRSVSGSFNHVRDARQVALVLAVSCAVLQTAFWLKFARSRCAAGPCAGRRKSVERRLWRQRLKCNSRVKDMFLLVSRFQKQHKISRRNC
jgi:hypothetical protein